MGDEGSWNFIIGLCKLFDGDLFVPLLADKNHLIADFAVDAGNVDHHLIHADPSDLRATLPADKDVEFFRHASFHAVGIADGDRGDFCFAFRHIDLTVANAFAGFNGFNVADLCL